MSNHNRLKIKVSESGVAFYITAALMQKLGGDKSKILIFAKRQDDPGKYRVSIRESKQGPTRITENQNSKEFPFKIDFRRNFLPAPFDKFPHTPVGSPVLKAIAPDDKYPRQLHFDLSFQELTGVVNDPKDFKGALAGLKEQMIVAKTPARIIDKTDDWERRQDAERQQVAVADIPPAETRDHRTRFADALKEFNGALCHDLDDIELYVERFDELGKTVETIRLPVPSQMRIKGRVIREETFG